MNVLLSEPNRENMFDAPGNKTAGVGKRGIGNCSSSGSKRAALSNVTNRSGVTGTREKQTRLAVHQVEPLLSVPYGSFLPSVSNGLLLSLPHSSADPTPNISFNSSTSSFCLSTSVRSLSPGTFHHRFLSLSLFPKSYNLRYLVFFLALSLSLSDCDSPMVISSPEVFVDVPPIDDDDTEYTTDIFTHLRQSEVSQR